MLAYVSGAETRLTRIMLDNMVVPLENGDVDITMLKDAVDLINGRFDTEVCLCVSVCVLQLRKKETNKDDTLL